MGDPDRILDEDTLITIYIQHLYAPSSLADMSLNLETNFAGQI